MIYDVLVGWATLRERVEVVHGAHVGPQVVQGGIDLQVQEVLPCK